MDNNEKSSDYSVNDFLMENMTEDEVIEYSEMLIEFLEIMYDN